MIQLGGNRVAHVIVTRKGGEMRREKVDFEKHREIIVIKGGGVLITSGWNP